jgi:hypothetical protein
MDESWGGDPRHLVPLPPLVETAISQICEKSPRNVAL